MIVNVTHAGVYHYRCLTCEVGAGQERAREREEHQARVEEAKRRGACAACATKDLGRPAKWVRHRAETFCPTSGRRG